MTKQLQQARTGRPRLPVEKARCKRVVTFVTRSEMKQLEQLATVEKDSLSSVCHQIISEYLKANSVKPLA